MIDEFQLSLDEFHNDSTTVGFFGAYDDGGVPVYFTTHCGNSVDDQTHCQTWDVTIITAGGGTNRNRIVGATPLIQYD